MKLYLVRHGVAVDRLDSGIKSDAERTLTHEGQEEVELVARGLKKSGVKLDLLVSSPLVRANQTADIFAEIFKVELKICRALAPGGDAAELFDFLKNQKAEAIALFGHEPDMSELACRLLGADFNIPFKKAGVCRIDLSQMPPRSAGVLKWFMPPRLSRALLK